METKIRCKYGHKIADIERAEHIHIELKEAFGLAFCIIGLVATLIVNVIH